MRYDSVGLRSTLPVFVLTMGTRSCRPFTASSGNRRSTSLTFASRMTASIFLPFRTPTTADLSNVPIVTTDCVGEWW